MEHANAEVEKRNIGHFNQNKTRVVEIRRSTNFVYAARRHVKPCACQRLYQTTVSCEADYMFNTASVQPHTLDCMPSAAVQPRSLPMFALSLSRDVPLLAVRPPFENENLSSQTQLSLRRTTPHPAGRASTPQRTELRMRAFTGWATGWPPIQS